MGVDDNRVEVLALTDLLEQPELLQPPPVVLPYFAWQGRLTMLAGAEKVGKSTVLGQGVAALAQGVVFLDVRASAVNTLYIALDEPLPDLVRRLYGHGARGRVFIVRQRPGMADLLGIIQTHAIGLVIIDTAAEFASGSVDDFSSAAQWQPLLKALRGILEQTGAAGILLHHTTRAGDRYADSRQLGAGVDVILTMMRDGEDGPVRRVKALGRIPVKDFRLRFDGARYELEGGEIPFETRVYRAIAAQPGIGAGRLRDAVGGASKDVDSAVRDMLRQRIIEDLGETGRRAFHVRLLTPDEQGPGKDLVKADTDSLSALSQSESSVSQGQSQPPLTPLYRERGSQGPGGEGSDLLGEDGFRWPRCVHTADGSSPPRPWKDDDGVWQCGLCNPNRATVGAA